MQFSINVGRLLSDTARLYGAEHGLVWRDKVWSWGEVDARVNALAQAFRKLGLVKGDRIMTFCRNSNYLFEVLWAGFKCGAVVVPTNFRLSPSEAATIAGMSEARIFVYDREFEKHLEAVRPGCRSLHHVVCTQGDCTESRHIDGLIEQNEGAPPWEEDVDYNDDVWLFFTSGTTGRPKAARLTHGQMVFVTTNYLADMLPGLDHEASSLVVAPLSHGAGIHMLPNVARGAKTVLMPEANFDAEQACRLIERHRVTNMFAVPTIVRMLVESDSIDRYDHSSLEQVVYAGAPMYREDQVAALKKLGKVLVQYYGLGEVTACITCLPAHLHDIDDDEMRVGSCGFARTGMQVEIRNPEGKALPAMESGEICVRGSAVFAGYRDNDKANRSTLRDGWFYTGDTGHLDEQGFLYITGRASEMYISGGSNIYPREIEEVLLKHPSVKMAAVFGVPDSKWGEAGVAVIVPESQETLTAEAMTGYLKENIASYKCPRRFFFWEDLPVSAYGKISRKEILGSLQRDEMIP